MSGLVGLSVQIRRVFGLMADLSVSSLRKFMNSTSTPAWRPRS